MSMALGDFTLSIEFFGETSWRESTWIRSESHIASLGFEVLLVVHDMDDVVFSI